MKLPGVEDMNAALAYKGKKLYIRRSDAEAVPYFDEELLDMEVYNLEDGEIGRASCRERVLRLV